MEVEELVDMDTDIESDHPGNDPIKIKEEEEPTQGVPKSKSKGKQVVRKSTQRAECWQYLKEIKDNGKRVVGKYNYYVQIYKAESSKKGTKKFKNYFPKCPENLNN